MALMPCHAFFQFYVNEGKLSCQLYQRSADDFLDIKEFISKELVNKIANELSELDYKGVIRFSGFVEPMKP